MKYLVATCFMLVASSAFAQESQFKTKIQEDMDAYIKQFTSSCGATPKMAWTGGKLGHNPREYEKEGWNSISTLCTSALEAGASACNNPEVKKAFSTLKEVRCTKGKGTIGYTLKGSVLTFTIDQSYDKNNAAGQRDDVKAKIIKNIDK